jgi:fermentation-respiration switch protein FrsA (DUF1100 family)
MRWLRAGLACCAIDLPGHGARFDPASHTPSKTMDVLAQAVQEVDSVVTWLRDGPHAPRFDVTRLAIGGMSLGGMVTLRRLCESHPFRCAAVEGTTGWLEGLYFPETVDLQPRPQPSSHEPIRVRTLDPWHHLEGFEPLPLLALHSRADRMVPIEGMDRFIDKLGAKYVARGVPRSLIEWTTWDETGAPDEHIGFGRYSAQAKDMQTEFLARHLRGDAGTSQAGADL